MLARTLSRPVCEAGLEQQKGVMKYKAKNGREYTLIEGEVILKGGKIAKVYYFVGEETIIQKKAQRKPLKEAKELPDKYEIYETKTIPLIRKKGLYAQK